MARHKKKRVESLDEHEGLSANQVKIILRELGLDHRKFDKWMYGQTCPIIVRFDEKSGKEKRIGGVYEYDLFRWIDSQKMGVPPVWD